MSESLKFPRLVAWVSDEQLEEVKKASRKLGISVADYVRLCVFEKIRMEETSAANGQS